MPPRSYSARKIQERKTRSGRMTLSPLPLKSLSFGLLRFSLAATERLRPNLPR
jgi:hypothetical protein